MKLSEMLAHLGSAVLDDRAPLLSGSADSLWPDTTLTTWLNDAQRILCEDAWVLEDIGNATAGTIQLVQNQMDYALDPHVIRVLSGRLSDSTLDLGRVPYDLSRPQSTTMPPDFFPPDGAYTDTPGRPLAIATDAATNVLRVRPIPDADAAALQVILRVARLPITDLDTASPNASPEIAPKYHMRMIDYAAGKALTIPAADAAMRSLGNDFLNGWAEFLRKARRNRERAEMAPVQWKFGAGVPRGNA